MSSYLVAYAVAVASLLAGATVTHHVLKPSLVLPGVKPVGRRDG